MGAWTGTVADGAAQSAPLEGTVQGSIKNDKRKTLKYTKNEYTPA